MPVTKKSSKTPESASKLYRSEKNRMLGGVCAGLGEFFNVDATLIRILFVVITIFGGGGILIYILLWLIIPSESSFSELSKKNFEKNVQEVKSKAQEFAKDIKLNSTKADPKQILGFAILIFGVLLLMGNFGILSLARLWKFVPAVAIIIFGLAILTKRD